MVIHTHRTINIISICVICNLYNKVSFDGMSIKNTPQRRPCKLEIELVDCYPT